MAETRSNRIRSEIRAQILSGHLVPGSRLPTERDLARRYGVSLTTINKVMTALEVEGLLERQRGAGTFVRPDLARRDVGIVLGPLGAPPGPRFWAHLGRVALESAAKRSPAPPAGPFGPDSLSGVRAYLAAGTEPMAESPLARDVLAGRLGGALLLGAGVGASSVLEEAGVPFVELATEGGRPGVQIAWAEGVRDLTAAMLRSHGPADGGWAAPSAIQLPPAEAGREMERGYREAIQQAGLSVEEDLIGPAERADGPAGWRWTREMILESRRPSGVRGLILAGAEPEAALLALSATGVPVPEQVSVAVWALAGQVPAFGLSGPHRAEKRELARLELDGQAIVQAGLQMLSAFVRGDRSRSSVMIRPRLIPGETLSVG